MSMNLVFCGMKFLLVTPTAVEFSHWMGVLDCVHPISMRSCRSGTISLVMVKKPASSASEADEMTSLVICVMVRTGTLWGGGSERLLRA